MEVERSSSPSLFRRLFQRRKKKCYAFKLFQWEIVRPRTPAGGRMAPKPRSGHRTVYFKGCLYSFGGYNPTIKETDPDLADDPHWQKTRPLFKELWCFNVHSRRWTKLPIQDAGDETAIPDQLASHSIVLLGNKMLLYGGTGAPFGLTTSAVVFTMDMLERKWEKLRLADNQDTCDLPRTLYGQAVVMHDYCLYAVGGTSGFHYFMDVHKLDLAASSWKCLLWSTGDHGEPEPRYRHELSVWNNRLYVLGGGTSFEAYGFEFLPTFDLRTQTWMETKTVPDFTLPIEESASEQFPAARRCHSAVQKDKFVYVVGGYNGDKVFRDSWRLNLESMSWRKLPHDPPTPVYFHASAITNSGKLMTFGGVSHVDDNWRTNAVQAAWVEIPSLRTMCFDAITYYVPDLDQRDVDKLLQEGIPKDLIGELHGQADLTG